MYRPPVGLRSAKSFANIATNAVKSIADVTGEAAHALFMQLGIVERAERENRRRARFAKRQHKNSMYSASGLNGKRAVARRQRQIAAGSLRAENGLVS